MSKVDVNELVLHALKKESELEKKVRFWMFFSFILIGVIITGWFL